jgi:putative FmdB family regulatory protein
VSLYEFACPDCGPFEQWRPVSQSGSPATCPRCHADATRVLTPPNLVRTPRVVSRMRDLEEKSAHEPEVVNRPRSEDERPLRPRPVRSPHPWAVGHGH